MAQLVTTISRSSLSKQATTKLEALGKAVEALKSDSELNKTGESNIGWIHSAILCSDDGETGILLAKLLDQETDLLYKLIINHKQIGLEATKQVIDIMQYIIENGAEYVLFLQMMQSKTGDGGHNKVCLTGYLVSFEGFSRNSENMELHLVSVQNEECHRMMSSLAS